MVNQSFNHGSPWSIMVYHVWADTCPKAWLTPWLKHSQLWLNHGRPWLTIRWGRPSKLIEGSGSFGKFERSRWIESHFFNFDTIL